MSHEGRPGRKACPPMREEGRPTQKVHVGTHVKKHCMYADQVVLTNVTATVAATDSMAQIDLSDVTGTVRARIPEAVALKLSASTDTDACV